MEPIFEASVFVDLDTPVRPNRYAVNVGGRLSIHPDSPQAARKLAEGLMTWAMRDEVRQRNELAEGAAELERQAQEAGAA